MSKYGDDEDKRQANFEKEYLKIVKTIETLPLDDIRAMGSHSPHHEESSSAHFSTHAPSFFSPVHEWYFYPENNDYERVSSIEHWP
ncbi:MAG: hypothetical protein LRY43_04505 [Gammaproteobacteria bacterium]|nr:hypothetical protein [Gammaproteobacteria bacterium]